MGTVFQMTNVAISMPGVKRKRVWLEPGYAQVIWPGLMARLLIDREDGKFQPSIEARQYPIRPMREEQRREPYRFWLVSRALRLNAQMQPVAVLVELTTDQLDARTFKSF